MPVATFRRGTAPRDDLCAITEVVNGDGIVVTPSAVHDRAAALTPYYVLRLRSDATIAWTYGDFYEDAIAVTGRWAYCLAAPPDIVQATLRLAAWLYRQKDTATPGVDNPIFVGDGNVIMPANLPVDVKALISPYVKTHV